MDIGGGSVMCSQVSITTIFRLGRHVNLDQIVAVGHDVTMADFVRVNPGATISGDVVLERGVMIGTGASVIQGLTVASGMVVGAGAAVVRPLLRVTPW